MTLKNIHLKQVKRIVWKPCCCDHHHHRYYHYWSVFTPLREKGNYFTTWRFLQEELYPRSRNFHIIIHYHHEGYSSSSIILPTNMSSSSSTPNSNNTNSYRGGGRGGGGSRGGGRGGGRGGYHKNSSSNNNDSRPTHFFAVKINSTSILDDLMNWQASALLEHKNRVQTSTQQFDLEDYLIEREKMHFTMFVLTLDTQDDLNNCIQIFKSCQEELKKIMQTNLEQLPFTFKLSGVHTFEDKEFKKGRVIFSEPAFTHQNGQKTFLDLSNCIYQKLKENHIKVDASINTQIHCTLAKTSKSKKKNSPKAFPEYLYRHKCDTVFGETDTDQGIETIGEILLCRMKGPNGSDGFYHVEERVSLI